MINKQNIVSSYYTACRLSILSAENAFEVIVQTRVGGLPPISKHREELKIQGEAEYF